MDAVQAVDLTFDALVNEVDLSKMRVFLSDVLFDRSTDGNKTVTIPFGRQDCTVFRKVMLTEDTIQEFATALRTGSQIEAFRVSLQMLGDLCGFGIQYFDVSDSRGYIKTATEVSSDNSALMRNICRHENALEGAITGISHALLHVSRGFGEKVPDEGDLRVQFDDSIVQDTAAEKEQDVREVGVTMGAAEVESRHAGLVDRPRRVERERPLRDGRGVVGERRARHLPGHRVEGAGGDRTGVDVETYGCGILFHREPLSSHCGARPRLVVRPLSPDPRSCDR